MNPTSFQFREMLLRVEQNQSRRGKQLPELLNESCEREADLHEQILAECRRRGWIAIHARMDRSSTTAIGTPDFVILAGQCRFFVIECKSRTGKLTTAQLALRAWAANLGHVIHEVRSMEEFLRIL